MAILPLEQLPGFELDPAFPDPSGYIVLGAQEFVLGRVSHLLADREHEEVVYLVVNTAVSCFRTERGEERLVPVAWTDLAPRRRQVRLPQISRFTFRQLPLYRAGEAIPEWVDFPRPSADDPDISYLA